MGKSESSFWSFTNTKLGLTLNFWKVTFWRRALLYVELVGNLSCECVLTFVHQTLAEDPVCAL